jgi:tRNA(fMet)-specific endonuclease VapC
VSGNSVALDTSVAIAVLAGQAGTLLSQSREEILLPVSVIGELRYGALNSRRSAENLVEVERLVSRCRVLHIAAATAAVYARLRLRRKENGKPIPKNDLWIAALSVEHQVPLVTLDRHFDVIEQLERRGLQRMGRTDDRKH